MTPRPVVPPITIRDLNSIDDLQKLQAVEKQVWGMGDEDSLALTLAIALKAAGSIFVGAFEKEKMVGFAFGFLGREHGQTTTEYALVMLAAAAVAGLLLAWATKSHGISKLFDAVIEKALP